MVRQLKKLINGNNKDVQMELLKTHQLREAIMILFKELGEEDHYGEFGVIRIGFNVSKYAELVGFDTSDKKYFKERESAEREFERIKLFSEL